jgi:hypothetical protein
MGETSNAPIVPELMLTDMNNGNNALFVLEKVMKYMNLAVIVRARGMNTICMEINNNAFIV